MHVNYLVLTFDNFQTFIPLSIISKNRTLPNSGPSKQIINKSRNNFVDIFGLGFVICLFCSENPLSQTAALYGIIINHVYQYN